MSGIEGQQAFQEMGAQLVNGRANSDLQDAKAVAARVGEGGGRQGGQTAYLGGVLLLERLEEPPFSAPDPSVEGRVPASGDTGRVSQIVSFTSVTSPTSSRKRS